MTVEELLGHQTDLASAPAAVAEAEDGLARALAALAAAGGCDDGALLSFHGSANMWRSRLALADSRLAALQEVES